MECPKCKNQNPDGNKFCSQCGAPFDPSTEGIDRYIGQKIDSILESKVKDRKVVEMEIAENVSKKLMGWTKIFGFFAGIPLTLASIFLIGYGIHSFNEIKSAKNNVITIAKEAIDETGKLKPVVQQAKELTKELANYENRILRLEHSVIFDLNIENRIKEKLDNFIKNLELVGFNPKRSTLTKLKVKIDEEHKENTYYDKKENIIYLGKDIQRDEDLIYREYTLYVLETIFSEVHDLMKDKIDDPNVKKYLDDNCMTIESGLADYFTCRHTGISKLGKDTAKFRQERHGKLRFPEDCLRDLENRYKFGDLSNVDAWQFGGIWGAAFWEICSKEVTDEDKLLFDKLLFESWNEFLKIVNTTNYSTEKCFPIFVNIILNKDKEKYKGKNNAKIKKTFADRGLKITD